LFTDNRYLFDFAVKSGIQTEFVSTLLNNVLEKRNIDWLSEECKKRNSVSYENIFDISLVTFGGSEILLRGNRIPENKWIRKKSKQVFIYLLVHRKIKFTKEKIIDVFFRDHSPDSAENLYHQVITNIRNAAGIKYNFNSPVTGLKKPDASSKNKKSRKNAPEKGSEIDPSPELILYEDKVLSINPQFLIKIDSADFDTLYNKFKSAAADDNSKIIIAEQAMNLFKGEFLPGNYDTWCEELREHYNSRFIEMCEILLKLLKKKNLTADIIRYARLLLSIDRFNETGNLYLIDAFCETGKVSQAKNTLSNMLKSYNEEFGEKPDKGIMDSIQKILERYD
jgi:two-component SAPR family response regulator